MNQCKVILALIVLGCGWSARADAQAKPPATVAVLGIQSIEGDDALAQNLSDALRAQAKQRSNWQVLDKSVSVQQLSLAHGCNSLDNVCLTSISRSLGVAKTIYGTLKRTNRSSDYDFFLKLNIFDLDSRQIEYVLNATVPRSVLESRDLTKIASQYIVELAQRPSTGSIVVRVNEPENAEVRLDGNLVLGGDRSSEVTATVPEGRHELVVSAPGYNSFNRTIEIRRKDTTRVTVALEVQSDESDDSNHSSSEATWLGWGTLGLGAVFLGLTAYSMLRVYAIDNDADMDMYRGLPGLAGRNICGAAKDGFTGTPPNSSVDPGRVASLCDEADLLQVLQYVFLGVGVVSIGVGITLLMLDGDDGDSTEEADDDYYAKAPRLEIMPLVGRNYAVLNASLRF